MSEKLVSSLISAVIGGVVGACVVFFLPGKAKFDKLEVGTLTITNQASLLNAEGKDDVVIREGSVLANNVILGKKFIGQQYQGHVFVGNRIFTSPDDLVATPMEQWKLYTEIGSTKDAGGEIIVRSPSGANVVGQEVHTGALIRTGFDQKDSPEMFVRSCENGATLLVPLMTPRTKQQPEATTTNGVVPGTQESASTAPPDAFAKPEVVNGAVVAENPGNKPE